MASSLPRREDHGSGSAQNREQDRRFFCPARNFSCDRRLAGFQRCPAWPRWNLLRPHVALAVDEADQDGITQPTAVLMGQLAVLLYKNALHKEAEPLMRRALAIVLSFTRNTSHKHPHLGTVIENHADLLTETGLQAGANASAAEGLLSGYGITLEASA